METTNEYMVTGHGLSLRILNFKFLASFSTNLNYIINKSVLRSFKDPLMLQVPLPAISAYKAVIHKCQPTDQQPNSNPLQQNILLHKYNIIFRHIADNTKLQKDK